MNPSRKVWVNDKIVDESEAKISIYSSSLIFGDMCFEMTRSFGDPHNQFKLQEHIDRLYDSAKYLHITAPMTKNKMIQAVHDTIDANMDAIPKNEEHRILIDIDRGLLGIYENIVGAAPGVNIIIADFPLRWTVNSMGHLFTSGINAVIPSQRAIPARLLEPKVKNRSRVHYLMANIQAAQFKGKDNWALLLDEDGFIAEGTGDNFFIVKNWTIYTPEGRNVLKGISRDYIFELGDELGYKVIEKNIEPYDVLTANEAFMTGTPFCMLPVTKLNGQNIGDGKVGKIYTDLLDLWSRKVGVDIKKQIQSYSNSTGGGVTPYQFK